MADKYSFFLAWSEEDDAWVALSQEFPGISAFGDSREEALSAGVKTVNVAKEISSKYGDPLPKEMMLPTSGSTSVTVSFPRSLFVILSIEAQRQGVSLEKLVYTYIMDSYCQNTVKKEN